MKTHTTDEVFGVSRDLPLNYVSRTEVDDKFLESLTRKQHVVIYGSSKQGKTCLRKHCLSEDDCIIVSCLHNWNIARLNSSILKEAGYQIKQSTVKTVAGQNKIVASLDGKAGIPLLAEAKTQGSIENQSGTTSASTTKELELDPDDANDIIRALEEIAFSKFVVLEDFHYLPDETQRAFSFALKAFHENSKICFIIVGVWRESNRLIAFNGDLASRVLAVEVDAWSEDSLKKVVETGENLLNVQMDDDFKDELVANSSGNVHFVQEVCRRACRADDVFETQKIKWKVTQKVKATSLIKEVANEQGARYRAFLQNFSEGFQSTELQMPMWVVAALLTFETKEIRSGIRLTDLSQRIKTAHPKGKGLNNGNITQILHSTSSLQVQKGIRPIVIDYDATNRNLQAVDAGFVIWLGNQNRAELIDELGLPKIDTSQKLV